MIKAVAFDYGGVLGCDQDKEAFRVIADVMGISEKELSGSYWSLRGDYDRGTVNGFSYWKRIASSLGKDIPERDIDFLIWLDAVSWSRFNPLMLRWAYEVSLSGRKTAICSNIPIEMSEQIFNDRLCRSLPAPLVFDPVVCSCDISCNKPEKGIYQHLAEKLGLLPCEILFMDDREENVLGAQAAGIKAVTFKTFPLLARQITEVDASLPPVKF